jgi:hypothetical protein
MTWTRYDPPDINRLREILEGLPAEMKVEADADTGVSASTVAELRSLTTWSGGLLVLIPLPRYPESVVKISKAT